MSRSLALVTLFLSLVSSTVVAAQARVPIPGTTATIALPSGCELVHRGQIVCGTETILVGGTSLGFDELRTLHRERGHTVHEPPGTTGQLFVGLPDGGVVIIRDGLDERLLLICASSRLSFQSGLVYARVSLALVAAARGPVVEGFGHLARRDIPYATVHWSGEALYFTNDAIGVRGELTIGGWIAATDESAMTSLCTVSGPSDLPTETIYRVQRRTTDGASVCEEAALVYGSARRALLASVGLVPFADGQGYRVQMVYGLRDDEDADRVLDGFVHVAHPMLQRVFGTPERAARHARR